MSEQLTLTAELWQQENQPLIPGLPDSTVHHLVDSDERETAWRRLCARRGHPAGCYTPWSGETFCRCGEWCAPGQHILLPVLCPRCWENKPCCKHVPCSVEPGGAS